jgi:hypothetical protein
VRAQGLDGETGVLLFAPKGNPTFSIRTYSIEQWPRGTPSTAFEQFLRVEL